MTFHSGEIVLNKYRIEEFIGSGASAEVYRVTHLELKVPRALKILRRSAAGVGSTEFDDFATRFQLEAQLGARLNIPTPHPNLLQVHDFQADGDLLVLEMEYAAGGSLAEQIARSEENNKPIPINEVLQIALDAAEGLAAIHKKQIVHRDLKPSNILFDEEGHAKVGDLGLAQSQGGPSMRSKLSNPQAHPGTPGYMSPEHADNTKYLPPASDIYALGLILFEISTGNVYAGQRRGTRAGQLRKNIPVWLDDLIVRMLSPTPEQRPWNGKETVESLKKGIVRRQKQKRPLDGKPVAKLTQKGTGRVSKRNQVQKFGTHQNNNQHPYHLSESEKHSINRNLIISGIFFLALLMVYLTVNVPSKNTVKDFHVSADNPDSLIFTFDYSFDLVDYPDGLDFTVEVGTVPGVTTTQMNDCTANTLEGNGRVTCEIRAACPAVSNSQFITDTVDITLETITNANGMKMILDTLTFPYKKTWECGKTGD